MTRLPFLLLVVASMACTRQVVPNRVEVPRGPIVFVGAHPDDELYVSPLLERLCAKEGRRCVLLVLTRGEQGHCARADGCAEGLANVRTAEMAASAKRLGAESVVWDLGDVRGASTAEVTRGWETRAGGAEALAVKLGQLLEKERPAVLITFDPRHGSTCHPAHRAAGALAVGIAGLKGIETRWVIASRRAMPPRIPNLPPWMGIMPAEGTAARAVYGRSFDEAEWKVALDVMRLHPSQFGAQHVALVENAPQSGRELVLLDAAEVQANALEDTTFCSATAGSETTAQ